MSAISFNRWNNVLKPLQGCLPTSGLVFADVPSTQIAHPRWTNDSMVLEWQDLVRVSGHKFESPLFVIAGTHDVIPIDLLDAPIDAGCPASGKESPELCYMRICSTCPPYRLVA
jgi:hypothetical protein